GGKEALPRPPSLLFRVELIQTPPPADNYHQHNRRFAPAALFRHGPQARQGKHEPHSTSHTARVAQHELTPHEPRGEQAEDWLGEHSTERPGTRPDEGLAASAATRRSIRRLRGRSMRLQTALALAALLAGTGLGYAQDTTAASGAQPTAGAP